VGGNATTHAPHKIILFYAYFTQVANASIWTQAESRPRSKVDSKNWKWIVVCDVQALAAQRGAKPEFVVAEATNYDINQGQLGMSLP